MNKELSLKEVENVFTDEEKKFIISLIQMFGEITFPKNWNDASYYSIIALKKYMKKGMKSKTLNLKGIELIKELKKKIK